MTYQAGTRVENRATNMPVYVPNLVEGLGTVQVLFLQQHDFQVELITPTSVDVAKKMIHVTIPNSGTFSVIYKRWQSVVDNMRRSPWSWGWRVSQTPFSKNTQRKRGHINKSASMRKWWNVWWLYWWYGLYFRSKLYIYYRTSSMLRTDPLGHIRHMNCSFWRPVCFVTAMGTGNFKKNHSEEYWIMLIRNKSFYMFADAIAVVVTLYLPKGQICFWMQGL